MAALTVWELFLETIWGRVVASQKSSRDSGETIVAARHQDVSHGPLGWIVEMNNSALIKFSSSRLS